MMNTKKERNTKTGKCMKASCKCMDQMCPKHHCYRDDAMECPRHKGVMANYSYECTCTFPPEEKKQDVVVTPNLLHLNGTEGLEGDRSKCCYAPIKTLVEWNAKAQDNEKTCSKCGAHWPELLTEAEKIEINKKATGAINDMMAEEVTVTVIHIRTLENVSHKVKLPQVRVFAEDAAKQYTVSHKDAMSESPMKDFIVVEFYHKTGATKVTSLEK